MIRLFVSDIDGCIGEPYEKFDIDGLYELRGLSEHAGSLSDSDTPPLLSICSGRPFPYVESICQILNVRVPVLFESGGGMFDPSNARITWHPANDNFEIREQIDAVSTWLLKVAMPGTRLNFDYAKRTHAGVIGPDADEIKRIVPRVEAFVEENCPDLGVYPTLLSIDILPDAISKANGLHWLSEIMDIPVEQMGYIGDSKGDVDAIKLVGSGFAPSNASSLAREAADSVTREAGIKGVISAYKQCWTHVDEDEMSPVI